MKYNDYMELFTVSPEAKSSAFNKVKQYENQIKETGETGTVITPETKRKTPFRMTPLRWVAIAMSIILVATATPLIYYFGFNNTRYEAVKLEYMENLMVDVDGVTAYSIRQDTEEGTAQTTAKKVGEDGESKSAAISLLSASLMTDTAEKKPLAGGNAKPQSYLYSTKESYESGNVEYNDTTKVTFMKNKEVTEDVYDNNGKLIDATRKIAQEELDAQINKIYTTKHFTYVQFVAKVEKSGTYTYRTADGETGEESILLRSDVRLEFDENGVTDFDKYYGYGSSHLTASFVIDNFTGYIYKIENFYIQNFENDLVWQWEDVIDYEDDFGFAAHSRKTYYSVSTDENNNLVFTNIVPNTDIEIRAAVMDAYGWVYVINNRLDEIDADRKIIYSTDMDKFAYDSDKYVYVTDGMKILKRMVDGEEVDFETGGIIRDLQRPSSALYGSSIDLIGMYENLYIRNNSMAATDYYNDFGLYVEGVTALHWMDNNYDRIIAQKGDKLYYMSVDLNDYRDKTTVLNVESDFIELSSSLPLTSVDDYYLSVGNDLYKINDVYRYVGATETKYYHLVRTATGVELVELTSKTYTHNVFIFQPINK